MINHHQFPTPTPAPVQLPEALERLEECLARFDEDEMRLPPTPDEIAAALSAAREMAGELATIRHNYYLLNQSNRLETASLLHRVERMRGAVERAKPRIRCGSPHMDGTFTFACSGCWAAARHQDESQLEHGTDCLHTILREEREEGGGDGR